MGKLIDADRLRAQFPEPTDWRDIEQTMFTITEVWEAIDSAPEVEAIPVEVGIGREDA